MTIKHRLTPRASVTTTSVNSPPSRGVNNVTNNNNNSNDDDHPISSPRQRRPDPPSDIETHYCNNYEPRDPSSHAPPAADHYDYDNAHKSSSEGQQVVLLMKCFKRHVLWISNRLPLRKLIAMFFVAFVFRMMVVQTRHLMRAVHHGMETKSVTITTPLTTTTTTETTTSTHELQAEMAKAAEETSPNGGPNTIQGVRETFYKRYGGKEEATKLYERGIQVYGNSLDQTATRLVEMSSLKEGDEPVLLSMGFGGDSVTTGRGNLFGQSYPFVLERILRPVLKESELPLTLKVTNSAMEDVTSFPYGFCLENFLGDKMDVMGWDYRWNEDDIGSSNGEDGAVYVDILAAYIRHSVSLSMSSSKPRHGRPPMMIFLDTNEERRELVRKYQEEGVLTEAIALLGRGKDWATEDVHNRHGDAPGFQMWSQFGTPSNCPEQSSARHPSYMEHELMGWVLALYFVDALELAIDKHKAQQANQEQQEEGQAKAVTFPLPQNLRLKNDEHMLKTLFGRVVPNQEGDQKRLQVGKMSCRTNFVPVVEKRKTLFDVVVAGLSQETKQDRRYEVMDGKDDAASLLGTYTDKREMKELPMDDGWVMTLNEHDRRTKQEEMLRCGLSELSPFSPSLTHFVPADMKPSLYGIPESGPLVMWLPYEGPGRENTANDELASSWFDSLIVCETMEENREEKKPHHCKLHSGMTFTVGGVSGTHPKKIVGAGEYKGKSTCVRLRIPDDAKITRFRDVKIPEGAEDQHPLGGAQQEEPSKHQPDDVGLQVIMEAKHGVTRELGACSISHVVWEQRRY